MRRENNLSRDHRRGLIEAQPFIHHAGADRFQHREAGMPLVHVINARRDPHGPQRANAADPQQQFLANAHAAIAAI